MSLWALRRKVRNGATAKCGHKASGSDCRYQAITGSDVTAGGVFCFVFNGNPGFKVNFVYLIYNFYAVDQLLYINA